MSDFPEKDNRLSSQAKVKLFLLVALIVLFLAFCIGASLTKATQYRHAKQARFDEAMVMIDEGDYVGAYDLLEDIGRDWGNVRETILGIEDEYHIQLAQQAMETHDWDEALAQLELIPGDIREELVNECNYRHGMWYYEQNRYLDALGYLLPLRGYRCDLNVLDECLSLAWMELVGDVEYEEE